jgi:hypothetical protein
MECRIYIFPNNYEFEWLSYPDIDWDSLTVSYKKHIIMLCNANDII